MKLVEEAQRYLAVVAFFRAQGCDPHWEREGAPPPVLRAPKTGNHPLHDKRKGPEMSSRRRTIKVPKR
jgi:hypothetical protein